MFIIYGCASLFFDIQSGLFMPTGDSLAVLKLKKSLNSSPGNNVKCVEQWRWIPATGAFLYKVMQSASPKERKKTNAIFVVPVFATLKPSTTRFLFTECSAEGALKRKRTLFLLLQAGANYM